eukprot:358855-Chlamydomonas_euryale.AAC.9
MDHEVGAGRHAGKRPCRQAAMQASRQTLRGRGAAHESPLCSKEVQQEVCVVCGGEQWEGKGGGCTCVQRIKHAPC